MTTELKPYTDLCGLHKGMLAFIIGAGTSLFDVMNLDDFASIHNHVVVSVNSSFIIMPWHAGEPDCRYWISNDALCRRWSYWPSVKTAKANRIVRSSWGVYYDEIPDFYQFWPRPTSEGVISPEDDGLAYCSSVPTSIDLCIQMGCKKIVLFGVDQYMTDGKSHFWQFWPEAQQPKPTGMKLATRSAQRYAFHFNNIAYPALDKFAKIRGVSIYNGNPKSQVVVFDKIEPQEALSWAI
jgi:hypothetical protein